MAAAESEAREDSLEEEDFLQSLRRAFAREPRLRPEGRFAPAALTVAVSRETGSRGGTIARRAAKLLRWQCYHQEFLEYLAHEKHLSRDLFQSLDEPASAWVDGRIDLLVREGAISQHQAILELARVILAIGAHGEAVILGRGAGAILPADSTLHVRIIAPLSDRIAALTQLERVTAEKAAEQIELRDRQRGLFIRTHFHRDPADTHQYDLLLNSAKLGEEACARLIADAAEIRGAARRRGQGDPPITVTESIEASA